MPFDTIFSIANTTALISWIALIAGPRRSWLFSTLRYGVVGALSVLYAVLISVYFFQADGAGYGSLAEVKAIFGHPGTALAAWVHYLAFDLLVGLWIAAEADQRGLNRLVQVPILLATFLFGPVGYVLFLALSPLPKAPAGTRST